MTIKKHTMILAIASMQVAVASAAELPDSAQSAMKVVRMARAAASAIPVLTGAEAFDVAAFREALRDSRGDVPYQAFLTARDVTDLVGGATTYSAQLASYDIGWAALEVNWVFAILLGDDEQARSIQTECNWLLGQHDLYLSNVADQPSYVVFASPYYQRNEASNLSMSIRRVAADVNIAAHIPNAIDPEGYVRQRLRSVFHRLSNTADFIRDAGEAYSYY